MRVGTFMSDEIVNNRSHAKSSVTPNGVPSSSFRAYRFPIDVFESSTRENTPPFLSFDAKQQNKAHINQPRSQSLQGRRSRPRWTILIGMLTDFPNQRVEFFPCTQRHNQNLRRRYSWRKRQNLKNIRSMSNKDVFNVQYLIYHSHLARRLVPCSRNNALAACTLSVQARTRVQ